MSSRADVPTQPDSASPKGIIATAERQAAAAIEAVLAELGHPAKVRDLRPLPFADTWGVATSVCQALAGDLALKQLRASGALEGLSKKDAKKAVAEASRDQAQVLATVVADRLREAGGFSSAEAVNGFLNIGFNANAMASSLLGEVFQLGPAYGRGPRRPDTERVMVEHSQPNTHKTFHIGHLRNSCLGIAVSNILDAAGFPVLQATYPGDIGMHVIRCLWCYLAFHEGEEPKDPLKRGRWLGEVYAEANARLDVRKDIGDFMLLLSQEDASYVQSVDRMLKELWRKQTEGEDIAYLLGRIIHGQEIKDEMLREQDVIVKFWPIVGEQLRRQVENPRPWLPIEGMPEPTMTPEERLQRWEDLDPRIGWWLDAPKWREQVTATFQRWERRDPEFVALWEATREWSLADFRRIFDELGATFDVWFFESQVEEEGRAIVQELMEKGIAEISDGLPVVKLDEKLGLETETYRTIPILRSDGTTLYSTKDLALTKRKFEQYGIDRAIWVVDARQSLYFQQIFKVLELWGFEQATRAYHLGYEVVVLPDGVISSRKGKVPVYDDIRDLVLARAREIIVEKNPELAEDEKDRVARQVGLGSLKYAMLARDNNKVVVFDLEEALSFDGHSAPYIQYAHARACRILENGKVDEANMLDAVGSIDFGTLGETELRLLQQIAALPEEVEHAAAEYRPLTITNYVYELARAFNDFYHACPVLHSEEPVRSARLALVAATRQALANGLALLSIDAPRAM